MLKAGKKIIQRTRFGNRLLVIHQFIDKKTEAHRDKIAGPL